MKKSLRTIALCLTIASCTSCGNPQKAQSSDSAIAVLSCDKMVSHIYSGEYNVSNFDDGTAERTHPAVYVANVNGTLAILPHHPHLSSRVPGVQTNAEYIFENLCGNSRGVFCNGESVINEVCIGMIPSSDRDKLLVFTTTKDSGAIHLFERTPADTLALSPEKIHINEALRFFFCEWENAFYDAPKEVLVLTSNGIVILKTDSLLNEGGDLTTVTFESATAPDWWQYIRPNSAVTVNGTLFIGEKYGIVRVDQKMNFQYYPVTNSNFIDSN